MYYITTNGRFNNLANAFETAQEAQRAINEIQWVLGVSLEAELDVRFLDLGVYWVNLNGDVFHDGFENREEAIHWLYDYAKSEGHKVLGYDSEDRITTIQMNDGSIYMLDLIGGTFL